MKTCLEICLAQVKKDYPFTFIDVGAMGGIPKKWEQLKGSMNVIAFEPDEREFSKLNKRNDIRCFNSILHEKSDELTFYVSNDPGKSSVYKPNVKLLSEFENVSRFDIVDRKIFPKDRVKSLDAVFAEQQIGDADFAKIDVQGNELSILEGCQKSVLPRMFGIQLEVEFAEIYENQPVFRDIDRFLAGQGFQLMDISRSYWKRKDYYDYPGKGQLTFGDALYFKTVDGMKTQKNTLGDKIDISSKVYKSILACLIYGMFDYAVFLANYAVKDRIISDAQYPLIKQAILAESRKGYFPDFWGKEFIFKAMNRVLEKMGPRSYLGWADRDRMIGNVRDL